MPVTWMRIFQKGPMHRDVSRKHNMHEIYISYKYCKFVRVAKSGMSPSNLLKLRSLQEITRVMFKNPKFIIWMLN